MVGIGMAYRKESKIYLGRFLISWQGRVKSRNTLCPAVLEDAESKKLEKKKILFLCYDIIFKSNLKLRCPSKIVFCWKIKHILKCYLQIHFNQQWIGLWLEGVNVLFIRRLINTYNPAAAMLRALLLNLSTPSSLSR